MGTKKKFTVEFQGTVEIELDEELIKRTLTEEWRNMFYDLNTAGEVASHIAYNLIINDLGLKQMDGFADLNKGDVKIVEGPHWEANMTKEHTDGD